MKSEFIFVLMEGSQYFHRKGFSTVLMEKMFLTVLTGKCVECKQKYVKSKMLEQTFVTIQVPIRKSKSKESNSEVKVKNQSQI